ncbi:MAG: o-succinylbenzoate synthase [Flavobacteriaceae bacterium]|nr:o-succinylbenzoate synthase [Bacteroidia bacterium]NNK88269.1 o-succinylbenzoate synthase [Flavobacteriaceae bacterium]
MKASVRKHILDFKRPSGTSRGVLTRKESWFLIIDEDGKQGVGECSLLRGLSIDDVPEYEEKLHWLSGHINDDQRALYEELSGFPSIRFGLEMALYSLKSDHPFKLFPSAFTNGEAFIPINGLIWMGDEQFMKDQIQTKIDQGFKCIKMKIGAIDFETELNLLRKIRKRFSKEDIELRVDANGAFQPENALFKLEQLSVLDLHSIEQPIKQGQVKEMARLCANSPLDIALDEELIGVEDVTKRQELLQTINPKYVILKPSLLGGFRDSEEWINLAESMDIGWWVTSALESNIGLNAIAQWTYNLKSNMYQGLGTGGLYTNNIPSPLVVKNGTLRYEPEINWRFN